MEYEVIARVIPAVTGGLFDFAPVAGEASDPLLISPATILAEYIRNEALMTDPADDNDWPLFISYLPDSPTELGSTYNTSGLKDGRLMIGEVIQHYGVQLDIRSRTHDDGWSKAEAITLNLDTVNKKEITINTEDYIIYNVRRTSPVLSLGREPGTQKRHKFTVNFLVTLKRV